MRAGSQVLACLPVAGHVHSVEAEADRGQACEEAVGRKQSVHTQGEGGIPCGAGSLDVRGAGSKGRSEGEAAACASGWEAPKQQGAAGSHSQGVRTWEAGVLRGCTQASP